jgi:hypothetical protein
MWAMHGPLTGDLPFLPFRGWIIGTSQWWQALAAWNPRVGEDGGEVPNVYEKLHWSLQADRTDLSEATSSLQLLISLNILNRFISQSLIPVCVSFSTAAARHIYE